MDLNKNHISLRASTDISQICGPLQQLGINYFHFARIYNHNHTTAVLISDARWQKYVYQREQPAGTNLLEVPDGLYRWENIYPKTLLIDSQNEFNLYNAISLVKHAEKYHDIYAFSSHKDQNVTLDFYINHFNLLEKFILYFHDRAKNLISEAVKPQNLIHIPHGMRIKDQSIDELVFQTLEDPFKNYLKQITPTKFYLDNVNSYLTRREYDCLKFLSKNKTIGETATLLNISSRTVEQFIENAQNRIAAQSRRELINIYLDSSLSKII